MNLKRELPRIPFYENFHQWVEWGQQLMDLHLNYEDVEAFALRRIDIQSVAGTDRPVKVLLKADKQAGTIFIDETTTLEGIPQPAWKYLLGNRSAIEWILDQYKEKKPKDPTIREKFNTYKFADYKEKVIELIGKVCTVSVRTVKIVEQMEKTEREYV